jgi:hypothetical protein
MNDTDIRDTDLFPIQAQTLREKKQEVKEIPLDNMYVNPSFQRPVNPRQIDMIKREFHPAGIGLLLVAHITGESQPGRYAVIDGQTRFQAVNELLREVASGSREPIQGLPHVMTSEVFEDITVAEAALLFLMRNKQKPIPPKERDRVAVTEGDPTMLQVVKQSENAGYVVFSEDEDKVPITMPHRDHAKRIINWGTKASRPRLLEETLIIQQQAFGTDIGYLDKDVLAATAELLLHNADLVEDELIRVMSVLGLPGVRGQAEANAAKYQQRISKSVRGVLVDAYNKGKRSAAERIRV